MASETIDFTGFFGTFQDTAVADKSTLTIDSKLLETVKIAPLMV